jgi:hypothetical protein
MGIRNRESDIVRGCLEWLQLHGVWAWRQNNMPVPTGRGGYRRFVGMKGCADILGLLSQTVVVSGDTVPTMFGCLLAVEVKRVGERPRPAQYEFLRRVNEGGGVGVCVHSIRELEEAVMPYLTAAVVPLP